MSIASRQRNTKRPNQNTRKKTPVFTYWKEGQTAFTYVSRPYRYIIPQKNYGLFRPDGEAHNYKAHGKFGIMSLFLRWLTGNPRKKPATQ